MRYQEPESISVADAEPLLASDDGQTVCRTLVAITHSPLDSSWIQGHCIAASRDDRPDVRRTAAICFGHLARIHGLVDTKKVMPVLRRLLKDPLTSGAAEDALDDIQTFGRR